MALAAPAPMRQPSPQFRIGNISRKQDKRLIPTETGKIVNDLLVEYFPDVMDYQFTARMEEELDDIAEGKLRMAAHVAGILAPFEQQMEIARETYATDHGRKNSSGATAQSRGHHSGDPLWALWQSSSAAPIIRSAAIPNPGWNAWASLVRCAARNMAAKLSFASQEGRTFYGCSRYPECDFTSWKRPLPQPCPNCGGLLVEQKKTKRSVPTVRHRIGWKNCQRHTVEPA